MRPFEFFLSFQLHSEERDRKLGIFSTFLSIIYLRLFGTTELHQHVRYRAIKGEFIRQKFYLNPSIEIGAGNGSMSIQLYYDTNAEIRILTYSKSDLIWIQNIMKTKPYLCKKLSVDADDAQLLAKETSGSFPQVLILDVLEHLENDISAIDNIYRVLKDQGKVICSVPTEYYIDTFTHEFDRQIGHLRHYSIEEIKDKFESVGFEVLTVRGYTYKYTSKLIHFHRSFGSRIPKVVFLPLLNLITNITERIKTEVFSSIILIAKK